MSILPVATTRTSTTLTHQRLLLQLNADQAALQRNFDQLSTGSRVLRYSDDPVAAGRALNLNQGITRSEQLLRNAGSAETFYQAADSALARVDNALIQARGVAVSAAQTVTTEDDRAAFAISIRETINSVFAAGNSVFRDHQLLGGVLDPGNALAFDGNEIVSTGSNAVGQTAIGAGVPVDLNLTGTDTLGSNFVFLEGEPLNAALDRSTRLVDLRQGIGVEPGVIRLSGGNNFVELDAREAATIGDIADLISDIELEGRPIVASLTDDGIRIEYADGLDGTLAIQDTEGGLLARQLSISNPQGLNAPPLIGDGLSPRVTTSTEIDDLNGGAGLNLSEGIQILQGDRTFNIDFTDANTVGDVLIEINRSGADIRAELDESEGRIRLRSLRSGVDYSIGENGGTAAQSLGIRSATGETLLADLGRGRGVNLNLESADLIIERPDGRDLEINLEGAESINDVIALIRNHPQNQDTSRVLVALNDVGNGLQVEAPPGSRALTIRQTGLSDAGIRLGLIPPGSSEVSGGVVGAVDVIVGQDYLPRDAGGALDTLLRLEDAVREGDIPEIERLQARLDEDLDRASRSRGRVGVWSRNLAELQSATEEQVIQLTSQLSDEVDADLTTVISELTQRQTSLEASLRIIGQISQLTVLNFL